MSVVWETSALLTQDLSWQKRSFHRRNQTWPQANFFYSLARRTTFVTKSIAALSSMNFRPKCSRTTSHMCHRRSLRRIIRRQWSLGKQRLLLQLWHQHHIRPIHRINPRILRSSNPQRTTFEDSSNSKHTERMSGNVDITIFYTDCTISVTYNSHLRL